MPTYSHQAPSAYSLVCAHSTSPRAHPHGLVGCTAARMRNLAHHDRMRTTPCETAAAPMYPPTHDSCAASAASRTAGPKVHRFLSSHLVHVYHQYEHGVARTKAHCLAWSRRDMRQMAHGVAGRVWPAGFRYSAVCVVHCPIAGHRVHRGRVAIGRCGIARAGVPGFALMSERHMFF
jgi:hypothetical protein